RDGSAVFHAHLDRASPARPRGPRHRPDPAVVGHADLGGGGDRRGAGPGPLHGAARWGPDGEDPLAGAPGTSGGPGVARRVGVRPAPLPAVDLLRHRRAEGRGVLLCVATRSGRRGQGLGVHGRRTGQARGGAGGTRPRSCWWGTGRSGTVGSSRAWGARWISLRRTCPI